MPLKELSFLFFKSLIFPALTTFAFNIELRF